MKDSLEHFGVLGMHWGVRRASTSNPSEDHIRTSALKKKKVSELSNAELQQIVTRAQLVKQYKDLDPSKTEKGKKVVTGYMKSYGKQVASALVTAAATATGTYLVNRFFKR